jgi:hypothetical protein
MDDVQTFCRNCAVRHMELMVVVKAMMIASARGDDEAYNQLVRQKNALIASSLDYMYEHWELMDEPTQNDWLECAAELPMSMEEDEDGEVHG